MSRVKLIISILIVGLIIAAYYGNSFYWENVKVYSVNREVKLNDIIVNIDEVVLMPEFFLGEPFHRELTVKGTIADISADSKYTDKLYELVKVYVEDGPGMGFEQETQQTKHLYFWTYRVYDGRETINLIIENNINNQKIPLTIDLHDYNSRWVNKEKIQWRR